MRLAGVFAALVLLSTRDLNAAVLQLGPGANSWTIGVEYPTIQARVGDILVGDALDLPVPPSYERWRA